MTNLTKIFRLLLVAVFCCLLLPKFSGAQTNGEERKIIIDLPTGNYTSARDNTAVYPSAAVDAIRSQPIATKNADGSARSQEEISADIRKQEEMVNEVIRKSAATPAQQETEKVEVALPESISTNKKAAVSDVTGCSADYGLFSGLITTGGKIFSGLRELIYVVAGFGIIGVSVGGFFGNLNYKWLGAIVISLVVIATTGELINAITGCKTFTTSVIQDTLK